MICLTDSALTAVRSAISRADAPIEGLRIAVDAGGCAGLKYMMALTAQVDPDDIVAECEGVRVFAGRDSAMYLDGATMPVRHAVRLSKEAAPC